MITKKDVHVFENYIVAGLDKDMFCDNINCVFPLDTEENVFKSGAALISKSVEKCYTANERLYMFSRLIEAAKNMSEDTYSKLGNILKGGQSVDKVYTHDEMMAEVEKLAAIKAQELTKEQSNQAESEQLKAQLTALEAEKAAKEAEAQAAKAELEKIQAQIEADRLQAEKNKKAAERIDFLASEAIILDSTKDVALSFMREFTDEQFSQMKSIFVEIAEKAKDKKKEEEEKKDDKAKAGLVAQSTELPKAVDTTDASAGVNSLDKVFADIFKK